MRFHARAAGFAPSRSAPLRAGGAGALFVLVALFVLLAGLVEAGALSTLDQFSLDHLMPALRPPVGASEGILTGTYRPFGLTAAWWEVILDLWVYPCSLLVSALLVATALVVSRRRDGAVSPFAAALAGAWLAGNVVELAGKSLVTRPSLYVTAGGARAHITAFDDSFPSGHMIRGAIVLAALGLLLPRAKRWLRLWYVLVAPFLVFTSAHTPSDVVGGLLLGLALVACARMLAASSAFGVGRGGRWRIYDRWLRQASAR